MEKFNPDDIKKVFGPLLEGDNLDKKYPSAYMKVFIDKLAEFIKWTIAYIDDRVTYLESKLASGLSSMQDNVNSANGAIGAVDIRVTKLEKDFKEYEKVYKQYVNAEITKLRKQLGI